LFHFLVTHLAQAVGSQLKAVEPRVLHLIFIVAGNTFFDLHVFPVRRYLPVFRAVVAFAALVEFLVFPVGKPGGPFAAGTLQFHIFRAGVGRPANVSRTLQEDNNEKRCR
jgi:hypothetical protein